MVSPSTLGGVPVLKRLTSKPIFASDAESLDAYGNPAGPVALMISPVIVLESR